MTQTVIFHSGFANNIWVRNFFARNRQTLEARGIGAVEARTPYVLAHAHDYQADADPALLLADVGACLHKGAHTVLAPAHSWNWRPEALGAMLRLCRKNFPKIRLLWHFTMIHPAEALLYHYSHICLIYWNYHYTPPMVDRLIRGVHKSSLDSLRRTVDDAADDAFFRTGNVSETSTREELDSLLALAGITPEQAAADGLHYSPRVLTRPLGRKSKAWVLAFKDLACRFGDPALAWHIEGPALTTEAPLLPALPREDCVRFEGAYARDRKHFAALTVLGQSWEAFIQREIPPFPGLTRADVEHFFTLHTPKFSARAKEYLARLDPRLLTRPEANLFAPWLQTHSVRIGEPVPPQAKVSVLTSSYNHAPFIRDCLDGVIAQQTDFPLEHIVADDGSTDGTVDIIREYAARWPHIVPVLHEYHVGGVINHRDMYRMAKAPYVALCDGDDYFCDPGKLRMQAALLDENPHLALCFHPVRVTFENGRFGDYVFPNLARLPRGIRPLYYLSDLLRWNMIQTNSTMYRWRFCNGIPDWLRMDLLPGDWYLHLIHAETGKIGFINQVMGVYRRHEASQYYTSEIDRMLHRHKVGLEELETYRAINAHFQGKYASIVNQLACDVILDFTHYAERHGDDGNLREAAELYPEFTEYTRSIIAQELRGYTQK